MAAVDFADLKAAVKATIQGVSGIGKIETRVGGIPTWVERPGPYRVFWEIGVLSVAETHYAAGDCVWEDPLVQLEGASPFSYADNTEATWDTLLVAVRAALRENPNLVVDGVPTVTGRTAGFGLPQLITNDLATFSDGQKDVRVHHAVIQVRYRNDFDFETE